MNIIDSVLWGNIAPEGQGHEIAIRRADDPSVFAISYSTVEGGRDDAYVDDNCTVIWGPGTTESDPLFFAGPDGDYYLSQIAAGQDPPDSPCVDSGSDSASEIYIFGTTRTDGYGDSGIVDMGFHYNAELEEPPPPPIPTVSEWGMVVMTLLLLTGVTLVYMRRWPAKA